MLQVCEGRQKQELYKDLKMNDVYLIGRGTASDLVNEISRLMGGQMEPPDRNLIL